MRKAFPNLSQIFLPGESGTDRDPLRERLEYAGLTGKETVVDAYCGTGTIGMIASDKAAKVIGVELNADAVRDARNNAKANQIRNIQFYQNDAGKFLVEMAGQGAKVDVVLMDPPEAAAPKNS